ncbi:uncharacterized protein LOC103934380 isoform X6 [Pyrus x bretschneideri]|uniref:uncharacterized protein LOC103934380 isoform X6 n=1 Tax=Pyrus x bretschneideri TaxID=225117 RepID=UPI00202F352F|nr:uncharacterized protein LOC103934380 isoform X6 [Pyrus x bretschneideri]
MEKLALPFASTDFSSSLSSSESLASARRKSPIRKLGFPAFSLEIFAIATPPNLHPLFRTGGVLIFHSFSSLLQELPNSVLFVW